MKFFLSIPVVALVCGLCFQSAPAAANQVIQMQGAEAAQLSQALVNAGAKFQINIDAGTLRLSSLQCAEGGGFVSLPPHCQFNDLTTGQLVTVPGGFDQSPSIELVTILRNAGVPLMTVDQGELHESTLTVKSIGCSSILVTRSHNCTVIF